MRIYVAGKFEEAAKVRKLMDVFEADGHSVTYDWTPHYFTPRPHDDGENYRQAYVDRRGVFFCEALVMLLHPQCKGAWVEVGMAVGSFPTGRRVILIPDPSAGDIKHQLCVFQHLEDVFVVGTISEARALLKQWDEDAERSNGVPIDDADARDTEPFAMPCVEDIEG